MKNDNSILDILQRMRDLMKNGYESTEEIEIKQEYDELMKILKAEKEDRVITSVKVIQDVAEDISKETAESLKDLGVYLD